MIFYCSLHFTSQTFYSLKTPQGYLTCSPQEAIELGNLSPDQVANGFRYWKSVVDKELQKLKFLPNDSVYYCIVVSKLTEHIVKTVRTAALACGMEAVGEKRVTIEEESRVVVRYLKQTGVVAKDTITFIKVSSDFVQVRTEIDGVGIGQTTGTTVGVSSLDSLFLNYVVQKYPLTREVVSSNSDAARKDLLISFRQLKQVFENGNQWTAGAYMIPVPQSLKHVFKDDKIEVKVQELKDIYEYLIQNILQVLTTHINNGYANDKRFEMQPIRLLYIGKQSNYISFRLDTFAKVNTLGIVNWPCEIEKMAMIGAITAIELITNRDGESNVPFKVPKLEEFFKSREDLPNSIPTQPVTVNSPPQAIYQRPVLNSGPVVGNFNSNNQQYRPQQPLSNFQQFQQPGLNQPRPMEQQPRPYQQQPGPIADQQKPSLDSTSTPTPYHQQSPQPSVYQQMPLPVRPVEKPLPLPLEKPLPTPVQLTPPVPDKYEQPPVHHIPVRQQSPPPEHIQTPVKDPDPSKYDQEETQKFELECQSESPSIPTLISLYTSGANPSTSLQTAIITLNQVLFDFLLTLDIDLEWRDDDGNTALLVASACGSVEMTRTLIFRKVDISVINKSGSNCVICATQNDYRMEIMELVVGAGGDVNVVNRYGTGVERAIDELDVTGEDKAKLRRLVGR